MTRRRFFGIALTLLVLSSVSIDRGRTLLLVDSNGAPLDPVFSVSHHEGYRLNPAHSTTYEGYSPIDRPEQFPRTSGNPASVHLHWPFPIETHPALKVDFVYAPARHNGLAAIADSAINWPGPFDVAGDLASVRLDDLSGNPALWEGTLRNMSSIIGQLNGGRAPRAGASPETAVRLSPLEYGAFLDRYRDVAPFPRSPLGYRFPKSKRGARWLIGTWPTNPNGEMSLNGYLLAKSTASAASNRIRNEPFLRASVHDDLQFPKPPAASH